MILSYHPCFVGDKNRLCAGREPDDSDQTAIRAAAAVILPQGCSRSLWEMARDGCPNVFPNFDCRFAYSGKTGQARLFRETGIPHPATTVVTRLAATDGGLPIPPLPADFPLVLKYDWGGEGESVFLVPSEADLRPMLETARRAEGRGRRGIVLQQFIPHDRSLRVTVVGNRSIAYWRVNPTTDNFQANLAAGGRIDRRWRPDLMQTATTSVARWCRRLKIDLAGFDILFDLRRPDPLPLFLEINYFFGRRGLGGSEAFYRLLVDEIGRWLKARGLTPPAVSQTDGDEQWAEKDRDPS